MAQKNMSFGQIVTWAVLTCVLVAGVVLYIHLGMQQRQLEREIIYLKARSLAAQEQRQQMLEYRKRFEQQRLRQRYNNGGVVGVPTGN